MRVLFLDFDGVLHPYGFRVGDSIHPSGKPRAYVEKVAYFCWVPILADMLSDHPDVVVVVHSTWRSNRALSDLQQLLGPLVGSRLRGITSEGSRYESILRWLDSNRQVRDYRILDDDAKSFPTPPPVQLIHCHSDLGLSAEDVQAQLKQWLNLEI